MTIQPPSTPRKKSRISEFAGVSAMGYGAVVLGGFPCPLVLASFTIKSPAVRRRDPEDTAPVDGTL